MSLHIPSRLPIRLKQSLPFPVHRHAVVQTKSSSAITQQSQYTPLGRHASSSTSRTTDSAATSPNKAPTNPRRLIRWATPTERSYKARKALKKHIRPMHVDPYTRRIMETRTAAIKARQRAANPVESDSQSDNPISGHGELTPFVQSLELGMPQEKVHIAVEDGVLSQTPGVIDTALKDQAAILASSNTGVARPEQLANDIRLDELERFGAMSAVLTAPVPSANRAVVDAQAEADKKVQHEEDHATRMAALARILAVENQDSTQRHHINTARIVEAFGRHTTDHTIDPRQRIKQTYHDDGWTPKERIGPDTGSSEVQIALLTAKIQSLAQGVGILHNRDKANKRNLRLLLHRRQKLLAYFYKRDRAGERWQHMVEKLGITDAMWKGEIEVR